MSRSHADEGDCSLSAVSSVTQRNRRICDAFLLNEAYVADSKVEQQAFICVKGDFELMIICYSKVYLLPYN